MPSQDRGEASRRIESAVSIARSSSICCSTSAVTTARSGSGTSASTAARCRCRISSTPLVIVARSPRDASAVIRRSWSVTFDIADTTTTGGAPDRAACADTIAISRRIASASMTDVPPNFITTFFIDTLSLSFLEVSSFESEQRSSHEDGVNGLTHGGDSADERQTHRAPTVEDNMQSATALQFVLDSTAAALASVRAVHRRHRSPCVFVRLRSSVVEPVTSVTSVS